MSKKDKMADGSPRRHYVPHSPLWHQFLRAGDGSFPGKKKTFLRGIDTTLPTPKNREKIRSRSKPVETSCLKPPSRYQNF